MMDVPGVLKGDKEVKRKLEIAKENHLKIDGHAPGVVKLQARQMYQDFNYISGSGSWIHLEFESDSITKEDLRRFREYEAATSRSFNVAVVTYVICTSGVKQLLSKLTEGINSYQVKVIRLKNRDADRVIEQLEEKQKQGKTLDKADLVPLLLTCLLYTSRCV